MAVRSNKKESFKIKGNLSQVKPIILQSLQLAKFKKIQDNTFLNQITASYHSMTLVGNIRITLYEQPDFIQVDAEAVANVDNIYTLFRSPTQKILDKFKESIRFRTTNPL